MDKKDWGKSIKLTFIVLFGVSLFWFLFSCQLLWAYDPGGTPLDLKKNSRMNDTVLIQPGTGTSGGSDTARFRMYYGTQACVGVGSNGYLLQGTLTGIPYIDYLYSAGSSTINFSGFTHVSVGGSDIPSASSVTGKIDAVGGTGTTNVFTDTTLAGQGTLTATFRANGVDVSPTEVSMLDGATVPLNTVTGSITNHTHTGSDGTTQIAHNNVIGTGTNSHPTIDNFIASKASASGLASLDSNSLVVQNPASGTSTPGVAKMPISLGTGKLDDSWLSDNITKLGTPSTDSISEGSTNKYYQDTRVNVAVGSLSINTLNDVNISMSNEGDFVKIVGGQLIAGSSSSTAAFPEVTGSASASQLPPVSALIGSATSEQLPTVIKLSGTTTQQAAGEYGQLYVQNSDGISSSSGSGTVLFLNMDNPGTSTFTDSSGLGHIVTTTGNVIGTTTAMFGSGGGSFEGTGDYLTVAGSSYWDFTNKDYAISFCAKPSSFPANMVWMLQDIDGNSSVSGGIDYGIYTASNEIRWSFDTDSWWNTGIILGTSSYQCIELSVTNGIAYAFLDGILKGTTTVDVALGASSAAITLGREYNLTNYIGLLDDFVVQVGNDVGHVANFTPYSTHTQYSAKYVEPVNGNTVFEIFTPGTATAEASYIYNNVTTTVWGLGTNTAITGTSSGAYAGWSNRPIRVLAVDIGSSKEIKNNIKTIKIKPDLLDAEGIAKQNYIANRKIAWIAANGGSYTTVVNETRTGSVTIVDTDRMESDFNNYIEFEWATDMNQDIYTGAVQKQHEKGFWQMFDSVTPKSWNPKDNPGAEYEGFVVGEMPPVVWGDDKQSVNLMSVVAYMAVVQKSLKADTIFALNTLKELITTGTVTPQKIDYVNDRLEVLNP